MSTYAIQRLQALGLSEKVAYSVAPKLSITSLLANEVIDRHVNAWRLIISGMVAAVTPSAKNGGMAENIYGPEAWFGEQPIINAGSTYTQYACIVDVELLSMPATVLLQLLDQELSFANHMTRLISWRAQRSSEMLMLMKGGNPCLRTVMGLGLFFEALAAKSNFPITANMQEGVSIPAKQEVLAQLCGVSRTFISEYVLRLQAEGWLISHYGRLELVNLQTWRTFIRRRRESRCATMSPTIEQILEEFVRADMGEKPPAHMYDHPRNTSSPTPFSPTSLFATSPQELPRPQSRSRRN